MYYTLHMYYVAYATYVLCNVYLPTKERKININPRSRQQSLTFKEHLSPKVTHYR